MRKPSKQKTGGTRMKELGYKPIQLWVDKEDLAFLQRAAEEEDRPLTRFVLRCAMARARVILVDGKVVN